MDEETEYDLFSDFRQDTVIGLQALSEFAELIYTPDVDFTLQLTVSADPTFSRTITVNQQNSMVLQLVEVITHVPGKLVCSSLGLFKKVRAGVVGIGAYAM